jgi:hypothetical protein
MGRKRPNVGRRSTSRILEIFDIFVSDLADSQPKIPKSSVRALFRVPKLSARRVWKENPRGPVNVVRKVPVGGYFFGLVPPPFTQAEIAI